MKKILFLVIAAITLIPLVSCNKDDDNRSGSGNDNNSSLIVGKWKCVKTGFYDESYYEPDPDDKIEFLQNKTHIPIYNPCFYCPPAKWDIKNDILFITYPPLTPNQSEFTVTYKIVLLSKTELILAEGSAISYFVKI